MKVLVISKVAWRDDLNGGNVLTNVFKDFGAEFAMISCSSAEPNNPICKHYYQLTDKMMVSNVLHRTKVGQILDYDEPPTAVSTDEAYAGAKGFIPGEWLRLFREITWKLAKWDKSELFKFVDDFNPDVIYAPCQGYNYMIRLVKMVADHTKVPVISYISDDFYTNSQYSFSPLFWINHFVLRKHVREIFKVYSLCYTMTDEQKEQCEKDFGANMKILRKSGNFEASREKQSVGKPIKMVYGGSLSYNRYKTLEALVEAMKRINGDEIKMTLEIYSGTVLKEKDMQILNDGVVSRFHGTIYPDELQRVYDQSDIALHVESFDRKNRHVVRMSFSTKIIDCMDSGCAVMAICDEKQAGGAYLRRNDCAICINQPNDIYPILQRIIENPQLLIDYQHKAFEVGRRNHLNNNISQAFYQDFCDVIAKRK